MVTSAECRRNSFAQAASRTIAFPISQCFIQAVFVCMCFTCIPERYIVATTVNLVERSTARIRAVEYHTVGNDDNSV